MPIPDDIGRVTAEFTDKNLQPCIDTVVYNHVFATPFHVGIWLTVQDVNVQRVRATRRFFAQQEILKVNRERRFSRSRCSSRGGAGVCSRNTIDSMVP